jgi:hypothetical protein
VTTSPDNLARTAELGWTLQGLKSRRGPTARALRAGDSLTYYVTGAKAFGAVVEVTGEAVEDHAPIWVARQPGEDYPWRCAIRWLAGSADPEAWVEVEALLDGLAHPRIRAWPASDAELVRAALGGGEAGPPKGVSP